jgi:apolipoprotein N-acyltransferase
MKRYLILILMFLAINLVAYFQLIPYAQITANRHMNNGPFLGVVCYVFSFIAVIYGMFCFVRHKDFVRLILILLTTCSLLLIAYQLNTLQCLGCAAAI